MTKIDLNPQPHAVERLKQKTTKTSHLAGAERNKAHSLKQNKTRLRHHDQS